LEEVFASRRRNRGLVVRRAKAATKGGSWVTLVERCRSKPRAYAHVRLPLPAGRGLSRIVKKPVPRRSEGSDVTFYLSRFWGRSATPGCPFFRGAGLRAPSIGWHAHPWLPSVTPAASFARPRCANSEPTSRMRHE
jgi:hypothetical protein